ncbi:MAG: glutathione S-transferase family protein [Paracoccaceae bacterium]
MLTIWGRKTSSNVQALMWCIAELRLECVRHDVGHRFGGTDTDAFKAMNPNQTVPVLQDGNDETIWETGAILRYLAMRYADGTFWPGDDAARAQVDKWAEWSKINIAIGFTVPVFWAVVRTLPKERDQAAIECAVMALEDKMRIADQRLRASRFLAGETLTVADIQFGHVLFRYYDIDIERAEFPAIRAYYDRLAAMPNYQKNVMVSYDDLRAV